MVAGLVVPLSSTALGSTGGTPSVPSVRAAQAPSASSQPAPPEVECPADDAGFEVCTIDGEPGAEPDLSIYHRIRDIIRTEVEPGQSIRVAMYAWGAGWKSDPVFNHLAWDLVDKHDAGHDVKVVLGTGCDSGSGGSGSCSGSGVGSGERAAAEDGEPQRILEENGVPVKVCEKSCLPQRDGEALRKVMHNKFFLIGDADGGRVLQTTTNFLNLATTKYQDMTVVPDDGLYRFYRDYFARMWAGSWQGWDSDADRTRAGTANGIIGYAFPRTTTDPVTNVFEAVDCGAGGTVRVAHGQLSDPGVADALAGVQGRGCEVRVIAGPKQQDLLSGFDGRYGRTHSKFILVDAKYNGSDAKRRLVFTGSHNPNGSAVWGSSDAMIRVERASVYGWYSDYFEHEWATIEG